MSSETKFDLKKILHDSTENIKKISDEAQKYLISLSEDELQTRLTSGKAKRIAEIFLGLLFREEDDVENQSN